jgi:hypothetical protein
MQHLTFTQVELAEDLAQCLRDLIVNDQGLEVQKARAALRRWEEEMQRTYGGDHDE